MRVEKLAEQENNTYWASYQVPSYSYRFFLNCDSHSRPLRMLLFSRSVMSDSLWPHGLQHIRPPYPSASPRFGLNSGPLSPWCHPIPSSSVAHFSSCPHSSPASGPFPMSQLFASGGQTVGASALVISHPTNIQGWFPLGLTGLISLLSKGLSRVFSSTTIWKHQFFGIQPTLRSNSHIHRWLTGKTIVSTIWAFVAKVMSLLFNTLSRFVMAFLPRSKHF